MSRADRADVVINRRDVRAAEREAAYIQRAAPARGGRKARGGRIM